MQALYKFKPDLRNETGQFLSLDFELLKKIGYDAEFNSIVFVIKIFKENKDEDSLRDQDHFILDEGVAWNDGIVIDKHAGQYLLIIDD